MSDLTSIIASTITEATNAANAIADEVAAATTNVNKQVRDLREDDATEDDTVKRYQTYVADLDAKREAATAKVDEYLRTLIGAKSMTDEERASKREAYDAKRDEVNTARKLLAIYDTDGSVAATLPALRNFSGRKGSTGTGGKRPRLSAATVNGDDVFVTKTDKDGNEVQSVTFSVLAQHISKDSGSKVTPRMLQEAAFEEAKTDDLSTVSEVDFGYSVDGKHYRIVVFPNTPEDSTEDTAADSE